MSLLKQNLLGRVVLGFPKPLECTDSFPYQLLTSPVFNGMSPIWCSVLTDPLRDGLNISSSLMLNVAIGQLSPLSSFCFLLHCFFSSLSSSSSSLSSSQCPIYLFCSLFMFLKPFDLMVVRFPFHLRQIACYSFAWISLSRCYHQAHKEWPFVLLRTV